MIPNTKIRIVHLIACLNSGGAETMLYRLLKATDRDTFDPVVVSLTDRGQLGPDFDRIGIPIHSLGMGRGRINPVKLVTLAGLLRKLRPQVMQTWMYHADLAGSLAALFAGRMPVCWGVHHTDLVPGKSRRTTILTARACVLVSRTLPSKIVCCSESSKRVHANLGYPPEKMVVIPNGFDLDSFAPSPLERGRVREELGIPETAPVVGLVARFDPQKDHRNFVLAAASLVRSRPETIFVLCGDGVDSGNSALTGWINDQDLSASFRLLGVRSDVPRIIQSLDVGGTSSSFGEAFPLVVGEAMASGVSCVVTDVGDSAAMVGETGYVVAPGDPEGLAAAWLKLIDLSPDQRKILGNAARKKILDSYNLPNIVNRYASLHESLVG